MYGWVGHPARVYQAGLLAGLLAAGPGCGAVRPTPPENPQSAPHVAHPTTDAGPRVCDAAIDVPRAAPWVVSVDLRCTGAPVTGVVPDDLELEAFVTGASRDALRARKEAGGVSRVSYRVDLDAMAKRYDDLDIASRFGRSLIAPVSSFLFTPVPQRTGDPVKVSFVPSSAAIATGLRVGPDGTFSIESHELRVGTYVAFAPREVHAVKVKGSIVRVALLDGPLDLPVSTLVAWVERAATGVADFYGRAPDDDTLVVVAPIPGRAGVPFGKLLPESGPGIVLLLGEHTTEAELPHDWVLVHELFHVGTPSYLGEGKWFDEGLATYFEPLIRARMGWLDEGELWSDFLGDMPRGLPAMTEHGLEHARGYGELYWGGALFCLSADVAVRARSKGSLGLEDGLRAVLAQGGVASEVWSLESTLEVADTALGGPELVPLARRYAAQARPWTRPRFFATSACDAHRTDASSSTTRRRSPRCGAPWFAVSPEAEPRTAPGALR